MGIGVIVTRILSLPSWATPALAFNNTTSLPLLLIQSLEATGILDTVLMDGDTTSDAIERAESYFLINAMVSNSMTFALGPRLLSPGDEDAPSKDDDDKDGESGSSEDGSYDEEGESQRNRDLIDEETTLLPQHHVRKINQLGNRGRGSGHRQWDRLPSWARTALGVAYQFANAPLVGAVIGAIIGFTPALHTLFFNEFNKGGYLNAWLTSSIKNIGDLFASLQIIVVGVKLSHSLRKMKRGEESGPFSWTSFIFISSIRFIVWPA